MLFCHFTKDILCPFRQHFSHIRTTGGTGTPFTIEKIPPTADLEPGIARSVG